MKIYQHPLPYVNENLNSDYKRRLCVEGTKEELEKFSPFDVSDRGQLSGHMHTIDLMILKENEPLYGYIMIAQDDVIDEYAEAFSKGYLLLAIEANIPFELVQENKLELGIKKV